MEDPFVLFGRAVSCPVRLELLRVVGDKGLTVTQAATAVGVAPSTAFFHFQVLLDAGLVRKKGRRRGCRYVWPDQAWALVRKDRLKAGSPGRSPTT
jgi:DNA-binding transcriptional ArsR family regulator